MKIATCLSTVLAALAIVAITQAEPRTWTNESGKEITAELARIDGDNAVLSMNGKEYPVAIASLSDADQEFIEQWEADQETAHASSESSQPAADLPQVVATMQDNLVILDGRDLVAYEMENPESIDVVAFYSSASWCGPCQAFSPDLAREYKTLKRRYPNFELVLLSSDRDKESWAEYIEDHKMPFPSLDYDKLNLKGKLASGSKAPFIPSIVIKTADGEVLDDASAGAQASLEHLEDILKERAKG
ncbi:MAG: thioredoxin-like domain-containing protein [Verrucomicrobiota bacterium]